MAYIGSSAAVTPVAFSGVNAQSFNGDGSTVAFTLNRPVSSVAAIEVVVNNVQQSPYDGSYSVSNTTLTFSAAPSTGTGNIYVVYRDFPVGSITDPNTYTKTQTDTLLAGRVAKSGDTMTGVLTLADQLVVGSAISTSSNGTRDQSQLLFYEGTNGGFNIATGYPTSFLTYSNSGQTGSVGYLSRASSYFQVARGVVAMVGSSFTTGGSTFTVRYSSSNGYVYVNEDASGVASTGTLSNLTYTTERMRIDSAGRVTMPYQPVFSGNRVDLSQIINVAGPISFTPVVNQGSYWNTSTNTFTCPVAGKYFVSFYNLTNGSATTSASSVFIKRNGSGVFNAYTEGGTSTSGNNYWNSSTSGVLDCQALDTITFDLSTGVAYSGQYAGATVYLIG